MSISWTRFVLIFQNLFLYACMYFSWCFNLMSSVMSSENYLHKNKRLSQKKNSLQRHWGTEKFIVDLQFFVSLYLSGEHFLYDWKLLLKLSRCIWESLKSFIKLYHSRGLHSYPNLCRFIEILSPGACPGPPRWFFYGNAKYIILLELKINQCNGSHQTRFSAAKSQLISLSSTALT